jgi:glycosyltransferase involved in cell wall biosynthesis
MQKDNFVVRKFPDLSAFKSKEVVRPLRICIATEEIVGPVQNGGIASTYYQLARMLVDLGNEVTILYIKGNDVEEHNAQYWVEWYAKQNIKFVPLQYCDDPKLCFSDVWQKRYYAFYNWLKIQNNFDVVHTSEWRGGAFYALAAKRLGLAFENTLFLVKTSSPHIWNRHYQMRMIESNDLLAASYAEQKTVEWADIVIGGSAHLLSFMEYMGYSMPEGRIYVQPNVVDVEEMAVGDLRSNVQYDDILSSNELVFFGRLEGRKGLEIFCDALDLMVAKAKTPKKVYFMGKQGGRLPNFPHVGTIKYIEEKSKRWPFEIEILDEYGPHKALEFLCEKSRIAIMPSLIENSTMAVYEALIHKVPFLATSVGGTPELIDDSYHNQVLVEPNSILLANRMISILESGQVVARPSFDAQNNMKIWRDFHQYLAEIIPLHGVNDVVEKLTYNVADWSSDKVNRNYFPKVSAAEIVEPITVMLYLTGHHEGLIKTYNSIKGQLAEGDQIVLTIDGESKSHESKEFLDILDEITKNNGKILRNEHRCVSESYNNAVNFAKNETLVFIHCGKHIAGDYLLSSVRKAFQSTEVSLAVSFFDIKISGDQKRNLDERCLPLGGDLASHLISKHSLGADLFIMTKALFSKLGGFYPSYHVSEVQSELLTKAMMSGVEVWVIPEAVYQKHLIEGDIKYNEQSGEYLRLKPLIDDMPIALKRYFLRMEHLAYHENKKMTRIGKKIKGSKARLKPFLRPIFKKLKII